MIFPTIMISVQIRKAMQKALCVIENIVISHSCFSSSIWILNMTLIFGIDKNCFQLTFDRFPDTAKKIKIKDELDSPNSDVEATTKHNIFSIAWEQILKAIWIDSKI